MNLTRVDTLLAKLEMHKHELHTIEFGLEISDFSVVELESLSANLDRAVQYRPLHVPGRLRSRVRRENQPRIDCYTTSSH
ncbi:MAG TPA: hypothetical protein VEX68_10010 [Bryobacteraceae bacterium]|nr:hypothetical protein [Bryobacteraceae bacterium]